jgi:hypothetical protein
MGNNLRNDEVPSILYRDLAGAELILDTGFSEYKGELSLLTEIQEPWCPDWGDGQLTAIRLSVPQVQGLILELEQMLKDKGNE